MTNKISFELNQLPPMYNSYLRMHYMRRKKVNDEFTHLIRMVLLTIEACKTHLPFQMCRLILVRFSTKEPDYDGLVGSFKLIVDGLIKCGVIVDDKYSLTGTWDVSWKKVSKLKDQKISITVMGIGD